MPNSANFMFTLKNTKPIIEIANKLSDNIDDDMLKKITSPFEQNNNDLLTPAGLIFNYKLYMSTIGAAAMILIKKDPFPAYEKLKLTNIPFLNFLMFDLTPTGATTYGIPGYSPIPTT